MPAKTHLSPKCLPHHMRLNGLIRTSPHNQAKTCCPSQGCCLLYRSAICAVSQSCNLLGRNNSAQQKHLVRVLPVPVLAPSHQSVPPSIPSLALSPVSPHLPPRKLFARLSTPRLLGHSSNRNSSSPTEQTQNVATVTGGDHAPTEHRLQGCGAFFGLGRAKFPIIFSPLPQITA